MAAEALDLMNNTVFSGLVKALSSPDDQTVLATLKMIREIRSVKLMHSLRSLMGHSNSEIRLYALKHAGIFKSSYFMDEARSLTRDADMDIRAEALHYLFAHSGSARIRLLRNFMSQPEDALRLPALLCGARESRTNSILRKEFDIYQRITGLFNHAHELGKGVDADRIKAICARAMGAVSIPELMPFLHILLFDSAPAVSRAALKAMGEAGQPVSVPLLIYFLGREGFEQQALQALSQFGPDSIDRLGDAINDGSLSLATRRLLPGIIAGSGSKRASDILMKNLDHPDPEFRYAIICSLNRLRGQNPGLKLSDRRIEKRILAESKDYVDTLTVLYRQTRKSDMNRGNTEIATLKAALISKLEMRLEEHVEKMFRLLGLKYPPEDIYNVYKVIKSDSPDLRMNAVEFLDNLLETNLKKVVIPIVESPLSIPVMDTYAENHGIRESGEYEGLSFLISIGDRELTLMALDLISSLNENRFIPIVGELLAYPDAEIRENAAQVLKHYGF